MKAEDFHELDKSISKEIMSEFKGKTIDSICSVCKGQGCEDCDYIGSYKIEY